MKFLFFLNSVLLGVGLAMDAFSVSLANGMNDPRMKQRRVLLIAGTFGFFQALMPMTGWILVHTLAEKFVSFQKFIPWIALILLCWIGGKMLAEGLRKRKGDPDDTAASASFGVYTLLVQGVATSIDALSVGFTIANYDWRSALTTAAVIAVTTFFICWGGVCIGKKFGTLLSWKASILGGVILIALGIELLIRSFF